MYTEWYCGVASKKNVYETELKERENVYLNNTSYSPTLL